MTDDNRTMRELAQEALDVQNACNLTDVAHGFAKSVSRLRVILREAGHESDYPTHPITLLWLDKLHDLAGRVDAYDSGAYRAVNALLEVS